MTEKQINSYKYASFIGIIGLSGFSYFIDHDPQQLFYLSYLAFFAYIPLYRELKKGVDERTKENLAKSNRIVAVIALTALILLGVIPNVLYRYGIDYSPTIFIGGAAIGFFCAMVAQVGSFFYFEHK